MGLGLGVGIGVGGDEWFWKKAGGSGLPPLLAAYRFDGSLNDSSGNGRHLTGFVPGYEAGRLGQALSKLDGAGTLSAGPFAATPGGGLGIAFWVKWLYDADPTASTWAQIAYNGGTFGTSQMEVKVFRDAGPPYDGGYVTYLHGDVNQTQVFSGIAENQWVHVAASATSAAWQVYLNGGLLFSGVPSDAVLDDGTAYTLNSFDYSMPTDMMGYFAGPLSAANVLTLYNAGAGYDPTA